MLTGETPTTITLPGWPAAMRESTAAQYLDLSIAEFRREVSGGRMPGPVKLGKSPKWLRTQIDRAIEQMTGGSARPNPLDRLHTPEYAASRAAGRETAPPPADAQPKNFSVKTLAEHWGCSGQLVRNMIADGRLPSFRFGNLIRIKREDVIEYEKTPGNAGG